MRIQGLVFVAALLVPTAAFADLVTLRSSDYAIGTDVSNAAPGATMRILDYSPASQSFVELPIVTFAGSYFGSYSSSLAGVTGLEDFTGCYAHPGPFSCSSDPRVLDIVFDAPTDFFSFSGSINADPLTLYAYGSDGSLLFTCFESVGMFSPGSYTSGPCTGLFVDVPRLSLDETVTVSRATADIARVVIGDTGASGSISIISYNTPEPAGVPEPTTMAMMLIGAAGMAATRRRRR
jgi:hypothetical protein